MPWATSTGGAAGWWTAISSGRPSSATRSSVPPTASISGRALTRHSAYSPSGVESATMPPPTPSQTLSPENSNVRIATLSSSPAAGLTWPIAPVYASRPVASSVLMICMARTFGAPVTDPGGNVARSRSESRTPGATRATTSDTRCHTAWRSIRFIAGTRTEPGTLTRPRSLRIRSTIMVFSARSLPDAASSSPAACGPTAAVPLIGEVSTSSPVRRRNSSGDRLTTAPSGLSTKAARAGSSAATPAQKTSSGSPVKDASSRAHRLAWKMSPAAMWSSTVATADR
jgi:hypothetical protein